MNPLHYFKVQEALKNREVNREANLIVVKFLIKILEDQMELLLSEINKLRDNVANKFDNKTGNDLCNEVNNIKIWLTKL